MANKTLAKTFFLSKLTTLIFKIKQSFFNINTCYFNITLEKITNKIVLLLSRHLPGPLDLQNNDILNVRLPVYHLGEKLRLIISIEITLLLT